MQLVRISSQVTHCAGGDALVFARVFALRNHTTRFSDHSEKKTIFNIDSMDYDF